MSTDGALDADDILARLEELRAVIADVQVNGRALGNAVSIEPNQLPATLQVVLAPPRLVYDTYAQEPTTLAVDVYVIAPAGGTTVENLLRLVMGVALAVDANSDGVVNGDAIPGSWDQPPSQPRPAYVIPVEIPARA